jgi:battenin
MGDRSHLEIDTVAESGIANTRGLRMSVVSGQRLNRSNIAFFGLGLLNNACYVIMIAGAPLVSKGSVGLVYLCAVVPGVMMKLSAPYWFHLISYRLRMVVASILMVQSFALVGFGSSRSVQLLGVVCAALQSSLGESSCLALSSRFEMSVVTWWSSGTGLAGVFGYAWVAMLHIALGLSFRATLLSALVLPILWLYVFFKLLAPDMGPEVTVVEDVNDDESQPLQGERGASSERNLAQHKMTIKQRFIFVLGLWPYCVPLFLVYFAEYAMQSGVWISIGFPVEDDSARKMFYTYSNWMYQLGVFISRSSGTFWQAEKPVLWVMPVLQSIFLIFFICVSMFHILYSWILLLPAFATGLLGGGVYVNAFMLISRDIAPNYREFSLGAASVADSIGVAAADVAGILLQGCLYKWNGLTGADFSC